MSEAAAPKSRGWMLQWLVGILLTGLAVFLLTRIIRWEDLKRAAVSIPVSTLLLIAVIYLVSMVVRAFCWQTLLQRKVTLWQAVIALNEGYFLNNILPFRLGELGRSFLLGRKSGLGTLQVLSTVVVERAYDMAIAASLLLMVLPLAFKMDWARPVAILLLVLIAAGLISLFLAARYREKLEKVLIRWGESSSLIRRFVLPSLHSILDGFSVLTRFEFFIVSFGALLTSWGLALVRDWIILRSLVPGAPFWWAVLGISVANLGGALPSMAASLGTFEGAATGALVLAGATAEVGLVYALVVHVTHLIFTSIIGAVGLSLEGENLASLIANLRRAR